jgi:hypothetical protein
MLPEIKISTNLQISKNMCSMKKVLTFLSLSCVLLGAGSARAQSFSVEHDTVKLSASTTFNAINNIENLTSANITIQWVVSDHNFPTDWLETAGVCDNNLCYTYTDIWPSVLRNSNPYTPGLGDFHFQGDLTAVSTPGPYYLRVFMRNKDVTTDTAVQVYVITKAPTSVSTVKAANSISLYPNPATSAINVTYDAATDVKTIAVYSIIGKQMQAYKAGTAGANINVENLPSGIYFVRLLNSHGDVVATRKFTKQ